MGTENNSNEMHAQMSRLETQLVSLTEKVEDIKVSVTQIAKLDKTIAEVVIHNSHARENIETLWRQVEEIKNRVEHTNTRITTVETETNENINKAKGAGWAFGIMFGVIQVLVVASVVWVFSNVQEGIIANRLQNDQLQRLDVTVKELVIRGSK
jgi:predicted RNase H-like nuclease (RuvC/YqgF family)